MYGLSDNKLEKIRYVFAQNGHIERAILYSSHAKGNYKQFSDIDITLVGMELTHKDLVNILQTIDNLLLPYHFDISLFNNLNNQDLINHINRIGKEIYRKEDCNAAL